MTSPNLLSHDHTSIFEHGCPYVDRLEDGKRRLGNTGLALTFLNDFISQIHSSGECPETSIDGFPTENWETIVQAT